MAPELAARRAAVHRQKAAALFADGLRAGRLADNRAAVRARERRREGYELVTGRGRGRWGAKSLGRGRGWK